MKLPAMYKRKRNAKHYSSGFTLLEILVAIIILSFGLLGMVGIQAMALKSNNDAKQQSAAVQLAGEYSDMMRGNKAIAVVTTPANNPYLITDFQAGNTIAAPTEYCNVLTGCTTPFNVASWEKFDWLSRVNAAFPGVHVQVCYDNAPYTNPGGLPQWGCAGAAAPGGKISIKIGWIRASTNSSRDTQANRDAALTNVSGPNPTSPPSVIYIVTPGS